MINTKNAIVLVIAYDAWVLSQFLMIGNLIEYRGMFLEIDTVPERDPEAGMINFTAVTDEGERYPVRIPYNVEVIIGTPVEMPPT